MASCRSWIFRTKFRSGAGQYHSLISSVIYRNRRLDSAGWVQPFPAAASGLGPAFTPGQSLLTGRGQNLGNYFDTEVERFLTARTSLTFVGGYSLLQYFDSDLLNYGTVDSRAGYNYQIDRKNTIGLVYTFSDIQLRQFRSIDHRAYMSRSRMAVA